MKKIVFALLAVTLMASCSSKMTLNDYVIVVPAVPTETEQAAAQSMQQYLKEMSGKELTIVKDTEIPVSKEILIGATNRIEYDNLESLGDDGFIIQTDGEKLAIYGGAKKGTLYGVYSFLEKYLGFRMYSPTVMVVPEISSLNVPNEIYDRQVPVFSYRDPHYGCTNDSLYVDWHKLSHDAKGQKSEWGMWVHTFQTLISPEVYYDADPTLFALRDGRRDRRQPCLSNPKVFEVVCKNLEERMAKNPEAKYWSISQNDNYEYCTCPECKAVDEANGSPSGMVITFANKVAAKYPDKVISTLAYQHTRKAPTQVKPAKNVNIMFCSIECNRSLPIAEDPSSADFRKDMEDWSKISDNILVWDYVVNFHSLIMPFPNLMVLQPNLKFFRDNHVVAMFEQGNGGTGGEFCEMKAYLLSKLMWNPDIDFSAEMNDFLNGYYGAAGPYIRQYIDLLHSSLAKSGDKLPIFDRPWLISANSVYSDDNITKYYEFFDAAEAAVAAEPEVLDRVKLARQQVNFVAVRKHLLDPFGKYGAFVDNGGTWEVKPEFVQKVNDIADINKAAGVDRLHESWNLPHEYKKMNLDALKVENDKGNLAFGKQVTTDGKFSTKFGGEKGTAVLTDGMHGSDEFYKFWLAFEAYETLNFVIDLEKAEKVSEVDSRYLQIKKEWLFFPKSVTVSLSMDGANYRKAGSLALEPLTDKGTLIAARNYPVKFDPTEARFVKLTVECQGYGPKWWYESYGLLQTWTFIDEITVR